MLFRSAIIGQIAMALTGAGIGVGLAGKLNASAFVALGSAVSGLVAAHAQSILAGTFSVSKGVLFIGPGEPPWSLYRILGCRRIRYFYFRQNKT